jgi:hypothetical protein
MQLAAPQHQALARPSFPAALVRAPGQAIAPPRAEVVVLVVRTGLGQAPEQRSQAPLETASAGLVAAPLAAVRLARIRRLTDKTLVPRAAMPSMARPAGLAARLALRLAVWEAMAREAVVAMVASGSPATVALVALASSGPLPELAVVVAAVASRRLALSDTSAGQVASTAAVVAAAHTLAVTAPMPTREAMAPRASSSSTTRRVARRSAARRGVLQNHPVVQHRRLPPPLAHPAEIRVAQTVRRPRLFSQAVVAADHQSRFCSPQPALELGPFHPTGTPRTIRSR